MATLRNIYADVSASLLAGRRRTLSECDCTGCQPPADDARSSCSCPDCQLELELDPTTDCDCADCQQAAQVDREQQQQQQPPPLQAVLHQHSMEQPEL
jgi:hypothetical protein